MIDIIVEALLDSLKTLPFLFAAYLLMEFIEHRAADKFGRILSGSRHFGPAAGALLGCIPQCGFSVAATNLYSGRLITLGTLVAVYLSTSDEAIPILLSHPDKAHMIFATLGTKLVYGALVGYIVDFIGRKKLVQQSSHMDELCSDCGCDASHGIVLPALRHTAKIFLFIILVNFAIGASIHLLGEEKLSQVLMTGSILQPFIAALIGLIPNCAASVVLAQLYAAGSLSFSGMMAGLLTGAGVGIAVLLRTNRSLRDCVKIVAIIYAAGVIMGILLFIMGV